jgi:predicted phosphodiesterase
MNALVLSDIHGNIDALQAVEADVVQRVDRFDEIWVLGDLVDYGAAPSEVIGWVRHHATRVVRGNHDHAVGTGEDCRSGPMYRDLAVATREYFTPLLAANDIRYLAGLPLQLTVTLTPKQKAHLVHASPRDLQFGYIATDAPDPIWRDALAPAGTPAFVFVGHTHDQFTRQIDETMVVNPGTVGLPKDGDPRAAYAVYRDGRIELRRVSYDTERAAARIVALPLPSHQTRRLAEWIRHARLP